MIEVNRENILKALAVCERRLAELTKALFKQIESGNCESASKTLKEIRELEEKKSLLLKYLRRLEQ